MAMEEPRLWWVVYLFSDVVIAGDVSPAHKIIFLFCFPDPQEGISVGCIDFSLMPESGVAGKVARRKGKERNEEKVGYDDVSK
jgi:hypothetical protein